MYAENMKRKVAKVGTLRASPNEEASVLKQERERRRKLRLQQVREQEKFIAQQIRQDVKGRRDQQLQQLAEDLRAKWESAQAEKIQSLEKIYLCTLNAIGEGHRQAKENEPDLKAIEKAAAANKEKAEKRHREALKELKQHRERQLRTQSWHVKARNKALEVERERAAKIASLPPPPPDPIQNIEVAKSLPLVKVCNVDSFSSSHYHLPEAYVDREMDTEQTDARAAAEEEEKRLTMLQQEEERERREQMEKASLRGSHALKMVQLAQDRDRLMKELEQMQQEDLSRRRQIVAKMPQQLFEPVYRRAEIREEWQRELETAFEDMYTRNAKMRGDMVLHLKPQPLPDPSVTSVDEDLDLTVEPEVASGGEHHPGGREDTSVEEQQEIKEPQSKQVLKRLLNRIRTQKDHWSAKTAETADVVSDTLESGSLPGDKESEDGVQEEEEDKSVIACNEVTDSTVLAGKSILLHPQEQAERMRAEAERKKKMEELEQQKQEQLELIRKLEEERKNLEAEFLKMRQHVQEGEQESSSTVQQEGHEPVVMDDAPQESAAAVAQLNTSAEGLHIQMIREYQQRLIEQNRIHKQSVDEARKHLQEYQLLLKNRYPHLSTSNIGRQDQGQESTGDLQRPQINLSERFILSSLPGPSLSTEKEKLGQSMSQDLIKSQPTSPGNIVPPSAGDVLAVDPSKLRAESPVSVAPSHPHFLGRTHPHGLLPHSPHEDRVRSQNTMIGSEKLSSTSSPGEQDSSSSTSYLPLPSALTLGLPQVDFSEPSISFSDPEEQLSKKDPLPLGDFSNVQEFRERLLSSAAEIRNQQDHLKEMQALLDRQRESLLSNQKNQEQHLLHKQKELEDQMRRHQGCLERLLGSTEPRQGAVPADLLLMPERERYEFMSILLKALDDEQEEVSQVTNFQSSSVSLVRPSGREQKWRPSKPPVTKTKLGPFLQQHELSAILEVETPNSGRRSSTGNSELGESQKGRNDRSGHGELVGYPDVSRRSTDSTLIQGDLSGLSASVRDETLNQSRAKLSWRETLSLEGSHDPNGADHSFTPVLYKSLQGSISSNPFPKHLSTGEGASGLVPTGQGRSPDSVCDYLSTTTISSGSFLTSEKADSSPAHSDVHSELERCNYSAIEDRKVISSSPSAATAEIHRGAWIDYLGAVENRSHIQQIIEKYTKDLSASLERNLSFHSPEAAADTSAPDNRLSSTFHSLDPKPDSNVSTPSYARSERTCSPPSTQESSSNSSRPDQQSYRSPESYLPHSMLALSSSIGLFHSHSMGRRSPRRQNQAGLVNDSSGSFLPLHPESTLNEPNVSGHEDPGCADSVQEQSNENLQSSSNSSRPDQQSYRSPESYLPHSMPALSSSIGLFHSQSMGRRSPRRQNQAGLVNGSSGSFLPLHPESTLNEPNVSGHDGPAGAVSGQEQYDETPLRHGVPRSVDACYRHDSSHTAFSSRHSSTTLTGAAEESASFRALMAAQMTASDSQLSEHPISESLERNSVKSVHFEELPAVQAVTTDTDVVDPRHTDGGLHGAASPSSDQTPENVARTSHSGSSLSSLSGQITGSSAGSLPSFIRTWDSESLRGILEEPDLTLISLNDSSIACSEPPATPTAERQHGNTSQGSFHPLHPEVDASSLHVPDQSAVGSSLSQHFAEMSLEFTSTPGSLQDAFLRKKRHFIESSAKRVQGIKHKDRVPKKGSCDLSDVLPNQDDRQSSSELSQCDGAQLKKVVEVRVSTPEDRKLSGIEMHQRTLRLYNRLDEVKMRREEKMRQESYAKNREKAKEFKKRTLEKLRGKR